MRNIMFTSIIGLSSIFTPAALAQDVVPQPEKQTLCSDTGSQYKLNTEFDYTRTHAYFTDCASGKHYAYECSTLPLVIGLARAHSKNNPVMQKNMEQYMAGNDFYCSIKALV